MIETSPTLAAFLEAATSAVRVDLYTLTLATGTVLRWTNTTTSVLVPDGRLFTAGPLLARSRLSSYAGLQVDELHLRITPRAEDTVAGVPLLKLAMLGGLRGCSLVLEWAFYDENRTFKGLMPKFAGQGSPVSIDSSEIDLVAMSELERLQIMMPRDVYQPPCLNTLFDGRCLVPRAAHVVTGSVSSAAAGARAAFASALGQASGWFNLGALRFTTGPNAGQRRTVRSFNAGAFTFALPFPFPIAAGHAFEAWPGCDRTQATCSTKFSNLPHFRGQPYVPVPEVTT